MGFFVIFWMAVSVMLAFTGIFKGEEDRLTLYFLSILTMCFAILNGLRIIYVEITKKH